MPTRPFVLRPYEHERWKAATLYVIDFPDQPTCEFERFVSGEPAVCTASQRAVCQSGARPCRRACRRREHLSALLAVLDEAIERSGFRIELFRPLDTYTHPVAALEEGPYRLYGLRFDDELFIAGAGAAKFVRHIQDDDDAQAAYDDVKHVAQSLKDRLKRRGLKAPPRDARGLLHLPDDFQSFA